MNAVGRSGTVWQVDLGLGITPAVWFKRQLLKGFYDNMVDFRTLPRYYVHFVQA